MGGSELRSGEGLGTSLDVHLHVFANGKESEDRKSGIRRFALDTWLQRLDLQESGSGIDSNQNYYRPQGGAPSKHWAGPSALSAGV
jgi:hypothetical protein